MASPCLLLAMYLTFGSETVPLRPGKRSASSFNFTVEGFFVVTFMAFIAVKKSCPKWTKSQNWSHSASFRLSGQFLSLFWLGEFQGMRLTANCHLASRNLPWRLCCLESRFVPWLSYQSYHKCCLGPGHWEPQWTSTWSIASSIPLTSLDIPGFFYLSGKCSGENCSW